MSPAMKAGAMPSRVTIQGVVRVEDDYGGFANTWAPISNGVVWARVEQVSGGETIETSPGQPLNRRVFHVTIRRRAVGPVNATMRVALSDGRVLSIKDVVADDQDRSRVVLRCTEEPTA